MSYDHWKMTEPEPDHDCICEVVHGERVSIDPDCPEHGFDPEPRCTCPTRTCWDTGEPLRTGTDSWCPTHGIDPDQAYDEWRDNQMSAERQ